MAKEAVDEAGEERVPNTEAGKSPDVHLPTDEQMKDDALKARGELDEAGKEVGEKQDSAEGPAS